MGSERHYRAAPVRLLMLSGGLLRDRPFSCGSFGWLNEAFDTGPQDVLCGRQGPGVVNLRHRVTRCVANMLIQRGR
jgi:hypothetical protein